MVFIETTAKPYLNINCICVDMSYNTFDIADVILNVYARESFRLQRRNKYNKTFTIRKQTNKIKSQP